MAANDYRDYDNEYPSDYREVIDNADVGLPFQDIPVTETEEEDEPKGPPPVIIPREDWGAAQGGHQRVFHFPVHNVIYSYTETNVCKTRAECLKLMKEMQQQHMKQGYPDIRFNFVIGGDGKVYEGTGWKVRAPLNEQYPDLEGEHIEFSHTGRRGPEKVPPKHKLKSKKWMNGMCFWRRDRSFTLADFPMPDAVKLINRLYDHGVETGQIAEDARVCIDYMWPTD